VLGYSREDPHFMELVKSVVLSTQTAFGYSPQPDECKALYARIQGWATSKMDTYKLTEGEMAEMEARLIAAEANMLYIRRHCKGDASETGLVQFAQPLFDLEATRGQHPTHKYTVAGKEKECLIPFSSDIKFNLFIRDMNPAQGAPSETENNLTVYMKGAPERILARCSRIYIGGEEVPFTEERRREVETANAKFGKLGERVLAFARYRLPSDPYSKSGYHFDVSTWKSWGLDAQKTSDDYRDVEGAFPMHDLCLMGVVSLNDPPRPKVDLSVNRCRDAGIKVIMVTGDQPPTAAAIANKVNILRNPEREFYHMRDELGISEHDAW